MTTITNTTKVNQCAISVDQC